MLSKHTPPTGPHVAIIMDGNGRWATGRGLPRAAGHREGIAAVRRTVQHATDVGIRCLTLYAFSADNWRRPAIEVQSLLWLLRMYLRLETSKLREQGVRLEVIGRRDRLPEAALTQIRKTDQATTDGQRLLLRVAIDYSSRHAIARAALDLLTARRPPAGEHLQDRLARLISPEAGDVDLLIRTGGEKRLSDFLLWECAYAELHFTDRLWPDFGERDLDVALADFHSRTRRFGGLPVDTATSGSTSSTSATGRLGRQPVQDPATA